MRPTLAQSGTRHTAAAMAWVFLCAPVVAIALRAPAAAWTAMWLYHAGCLIATVLGAGRLGRRPGAAVLGVVVGGSAAAVVAPWALLRPVLPALCGPSTSWAGWGFAPPHDLLFLLYYVSINPWVEELFWRGTLLGPTLRRHLGSTSARLVAVIGFLPMHVVVLGSSFDAGTVLVMSCGVLVGSAAWVLMHERCHTAWFPAASHLGADLGLAIAYTAWMRPSS